MTSNTYVCKKLEEFGKDFNKHILDVVSQLGKYMEQQGMKKSADSPVSSSKELQILECDNGRKLRFENIDYRHKVHYMTEENQIFTDIL